MTILNLIIALFSLCGGILVNRAYAPHVRWVNPQASDYLAFAIGVSLNAYLLRTTYWDVIWPLAGGAISTPLVNISINLLVLLSISLALKARLMMIPMEARLQYNLLTCAFYPRACKIILKRK